MDVESLRSALTEPSLFGLGIGFVTGFIFSFNPVAIAAIPVALAYVTKAHETRRAVRLGAAFIAGLIVTHIALGVGAALGGEWAKGVLGRGWGLVLGPVLIVLGLLWPGWLTLRMPWFSFRGRMVTGMGGAFLLAIPFSVAICPFCTPALLIMLTATAAIGSVPFGIALLFAAFFTLPTALAIYAGVSETGRRFLHAAALATADITAALLYGVAAYVLF